MTAPAVTTAFAAEPIPFKAEGPQPLMREIQPGEPYPVEALGPLRATVEAVQDISQAPVAIAAQSALAVASLAVQGFADVETLGGDAPCSLFCLTIAESGERKSTCDRMLMAGVRDFERRRAEAIREDVQAHNTAVNVWKAKTKRLTEAAASDDKAKAAAAEADLRALGPEPRGPLLPNLTAMDPTFEGVIKLYGVGRPSLGLFSDEGGAFIGGHAMNKDNQLKTMAGFSRLWNGEAVDRVRSGDGITTYRGRRMSAHLMVQPVAALPFLADPLAAGQGFLARFLIASPPSAIGTRLRRGHDMASSLAVASFGARLSAILETPLPTGPDPQELAPVRLPLSAAARELLLRFHDSVERAQAPGAAMEHVRAYASKAVEQAARLAGVLTLWENLEAPEVTPQAAGWGVTLADFYLSEARRLAEAGSVSEETARAERLRHWLMESWTEDEVLPGDILRLGPNALRESKVARAAITTLERHGWLARLPAGTAVRGVARKEAYRVVRAGDAV